MQPYKYQTKFQFPMFDLFRFKISVTIFFLSNSALIWIELMLGWAEQLKAARLSSPDHIVNSTECSENANNGYVYTILRGNYTDVYKIEKNSPVDNKPFTD